MLPTVTDQTNAFSNLILVATVICLLLQILSSLCITLLALPGRQRTPSLHSARPLLFRQRTSSRITIAYLLMALKKVRELLLLWFIETTLSVFNYLMQQASSELNYMPFCLR